jgi:hypothetical protein
LQSALPEVLQANQGTCRPSLSSEKLAMLDHVHLFFQKRHKSHVFKCAGYSCSATCASSPVKAASKLSAVCLLLQMVLSLDPASDAESHALDEAEPAEPPAETGAEASKRPVFAEAETGEDVSEGA